MFPDPVPSAEVKRPSEGAEDDLWRYVARSLPSRLAHGQAHGFGVLIADEWLRLDRTGSPCLERVELLSRFAVERGARERDCRDLIERARQHVADGSWRAAQDRRDGLRVALTLGLT